MSEGSVKRGRKPTKRQLEHQNIVLARLMRLGQLRSKLAGDHKRRGGRLRHFVPEHWIVHKAYACINGHIREGKKDDGGLIPRCTECNNYALLFDPKFDEGELLIDIDIFEQLKQTADKA